MSDHQRSTTGQRSFGESDDLTGATFTDVDLQGARFVGADLSGVVMRGVQLGGADLDAPWLFDGDHGLVVNGVDVTSYVDGELDRRWPGRGERRAQDPAALRAAWAALEAAWAAALERAASMPAGTVEVSMAGEFSFTQTLRHLVLASDMWLGKAVLGLDQPFHPLGMLDAATARDPRGDIVGLTTEAPSYDEVLAARASRVTLVRDFLADVDEQRLATQVPNPHDPSHAETVRSCLHTILEEEWEHLRYATRDLDAIAAGSPA